MKKYFRVIRMMLINNLQYIWDMVLGSIHFVLIIFIFVNLWQYLYGSGKAMISGYDISQMIWYLIVTELITIGTRTAITRGGISDEVKSGSISYILNKPINYIGYQFSNFVGEVIVKLIFYIPLSLIVGFVMIGELKNFNFTYIPFMIIVIVLGIIVDFFLRVVVGLLAFWVEDTSPFFWMYGKFLLVFGVFFPVELFPKVIADIVKASPIAAIVYGPGKIVVDFSFETFWSIIGIQIIYLILSIALAVFVYQKGVKKLNVNGG
ncbi:MAG: ABC transporter permease [Clostridiales bacterium GWD2_32_59]|nr:MAG: ABC transporter permease [Clostridiales bacterium GWD2_32_59]